MPHYVFVCTDCCEQLEEHFTMATISDAVIMCGCGRKMRQVYSPPTIINYRNAAELAERALRGEETVPGLTREESMATAKQMAIDGKR